MTGLEAAAGAAALGAAKSTTELAMRSAREIRKSEQQALLEAAKQTEEFKAAARLKGQKMAIKEAMSLIIMRPLAGIMGISRTYFETEFSSDYAAKIEDVPDEDLQTPKASIAGPVFEGLSYSLDEPVLKQMYLELLATASNARSANWAHPSFAQIVRELTSDEAIYLRDLLGHNARTTPIVQFKRVFDPAGGYNIIRTHVLNTESQDGLPVADPMTPTYVDNWVRLKLVTVDYTRSLTADGAYDWQEKRPERAAAQAAVEAMLNAPNFQEIGGARGITGAHLDYDKGIITATDFGDKFAAAVGMQDTSLTTPTANGTEDG
ncbi:hypothetical protein MTE01_01640 [Microbacterium testaceum]|uniref:Uncharacterized protein n=1 Tax=Microbacterium testaceum TaxID=2033 RepID=A0A4Y3QGY4_MICTE|nr:DUF4393 domain-containing protein [Microbacterium testaceum]GEB44219.1 hypothetical protein MTE01_01640 [Microbacterium testaceum]